MSKLIKKADKFLLPDKEKLEKYVENALEGKSNRLFELFGIPYDGNIGAREFLKKIN